MGLFYLDIFLDNTLTFDYIFVSLFYVLERQSKATQTHRV